MSTQLDPKSFPLTVAYVASLSDAMASYPECMLKTDIFEGLRADFGHLHTTPGLPERVRDVLAGQYAGKWLPEVAGNVLDLLVRDAGFEDDESFLDWAFGIYAALFRRPLYRALMYVLSPTLVVMGASNRWRTFHRGSSLTATPAGKKEGRASVTGILEYPDGLFPPLVLRMLGKSFEAAVTAASGARAHCRVKEQSASRATYEVSWDA